MALVSMGARSGFGVFVLPMSAEFGWNRGTISLAASIGALVSGLCQPFKDRIGAGRCFPDLHQLYQRTRRVLMAHQERPIYEFH
jgi:hypothetical protein